GGHTGYSGHTGYKERAPHTVRPGAPHTGRPGAPPRERFQGPPTARPDRRPAKPYRTGVQSAGEGPPRGVPIPEEPPLARLRATLHGYQAAAALMAAHALGVFPEVYKRPQVAADVARHLDVDPRGIETLLEALVALGMMHRHGATYVLPRELAPYFVPGQGGDATGMIEAAAEQYAAWGDLARAVREGAPRHRLGSDALLDGDPARVSRYVRAVHTVTREAAGRIAELAPLLPGSTLVDVAGGSGIIAAEYARRAPGLKATLFDLPPTIDAAREILREEGCADLVALYPGDYRSDPFPGPSDAILLSNVLQTESEENALAILRRAREALRPGGTLLVHGMMPPASSAPSADVALFALRMYLVFDSGRPWSLEQVSEWLVQEGFAVRASRPLGSPFASTLLVAARSE
ncbi:MAG: methyltransferase, partial [Bacteroidota bacterium]